MTAVPACFQFQIAAPPTPDPAELVELAVEAERLGYDRFWVPDQGFGADPFVLLAEIARHTTLPLGLGLTSPLSRHPVQIARAFSTLARLHPERDWIFALGLANPLHVLRPLGIQVQRAPAQLAAAVRTVRGLLAGERETLVDPDLAFTCDGIQLEIDAPAAARIYVGTRGPLVLRDAAGAEADGVLAESLFTPEAIAWARERLDAGSERAGRGRFDRPHVAWQLVEVLEPGAEPSASTRRFAAAFMAASAPEMLARIGVPPDLAARLKREGAAFDPATLPTPELVRFVAAQTPDELRTTVHRTAASGATAWCSVLPGDHATQLQQARRFAHGVMAPLRSDPDLAGAKTHG